jgi:enamine deaminase RidA (YjgF/YER057c/UK114 family)
MADRRKGRWTTVDRTSVNPWPWSTKLGFDQAQLVEGRRRELVCSIQDAVDTDGNSQHPGDIAAQLRLALDNLEAVLAEGGMTLANVVRLNIYTTDVDTLLQHFGISRSASKASASASRAVCSASLGSRGRSSS